MRGLKHTDANIVYTDLPVASFTDAWIETFAYLMEGLHGLSHLLQMRGLKQQDQKYDDAQRMSHLLQMRGLKHYPHPQRE